MAGENKCASCGQWAGKGHTCPATAVPSPTMTAPVREPVEVIVNTETLEDRIARARERINYDEKARESEEWAREQIDLPEDRQQALLKLEQERLDREVAAAMGWDHDRTEKYADGSTRRVRANGEELWTNADGKLHREDGPAMILADENGPRLNCWYLNGEKHRAGGLPAEESVDGNDREWYEHGLLHRTGGLPAVDNRQEVAWWVNGIPHRTDGPAMIDKRTGRARWMINGHEVPAPENPYLLDPAWANSYLSKYGDPIHNPELSPYWSEREAAS